MDEVLKRRRWIVRRRLEGRKVDEIASADVYFRDLKKGGHKSS